WSSRPTENYNQRPRSDAVLESTRAKAENHAGYPYAGVRNVQTLNDAPHSSRGSDVAGPRQDSR
ncbi:MAG TPA: hypothetical protein VIK32_02130, partial [Candidatus Limnocylindrales bacterium]